MAFILLFSLLEQVPEVMKSHALTWGRIVYPLLVHENSAVREQAVQVMDLGIQFLVTKREIIGPRLQSDLKVSSDRLISLVRCAIHGIHAFFTSIILRKCKL